MLSDLPKVTEVGSLGAELWTDGLTSGPVIFVAQLQH